MHLYSASCAVCLFTIGLEQHVVMCISYAFEQSIFIIGKWLFCMIVFLSLPCYYEADKCNIPHNIPMTTSHTSLYQNIHLFLGLLGAMARIQTSDE